MDSEWLQNLNREWPGEWCEILPGLHGMAQASTDVGSFTIEVDEFEEFRSYRVFHGKDCDLIGAGCQADQTWQMVRDSAAESIREYAERLDSLAAEMRSAQMLVLNMKPTEDA